ncbi:hypothetical protein PLESTB_000937300 [Pleodorina starrii]|uniref:Uncharacterized protein n=1 Tax=Pleodorina starrii TaxID=330485 RepID=A0A9W6BNK5_9CHLO|nr:hypothetical protein PLESTM_000707500 [Pleodorina starrii]GLC55040.1 hypothetical protein PLESTB_000937300 [Pleodorina starrii]GLC71200.1 hypothetical protein PLESTF_001085100 [Pleodorina starrii]
MVMSWVPALQTPRYVDVRFDPRPTILASRGLAVEVQVLYTGVLRPAITVIEYMLTLPNLPGIIPLPIYTADDADELVCPGFNVFPIQPDKLERPIDIGNGTIVSLEGAMMLGVRISTNNGPVERKAQLPSISAVGLHVRREPSPP